jgi:uncharacterized protein YprB with RNaseH-like and TPR domain
MLTATFLHAQGIGGVTERKLWNAGYTSWRQVLDAPVADLPLSRAQRALLLPALEQSADALGRGDYAWFAENLPSGEHWRAAREFGGRIGFLDIETNGGLRPDDITVIGVYDGDESRLYVKGRDLADFAHEAERFAVWVTFYGSGFDLPMLRRRFPICPGTRSTLICAPRSNGSDFEAA